MGAALDRNDSWLYRYIQDEEGASATEYAVLLVAILLVCLVAIAFLGGQVDGAFNRFTSLFGNASS